MYDLEGSDSKREWVEIYNGGNAAIDLSDWRFNDGSNHTFSGDNLEIGANEYAVVASDAATFIGAGLVIDTVMSLNNTADTISLLDENGSIVENVSYSSEQGGSGNGNSLQKISGVWQEATPTPNQTNQEEVVEEISEVESITVEDARASHVDSNIKASVGEDRVGVASSLMIFEGSAQGLQNKPLLNARYLWSFGDGSIAEGKSVSHTYYHPGKYVLTLDVSSGEYSASDTIVVEVTKADVEIVYADRGRIEITNHSINQLDLSFWNIKYKDKYFSFPKRTYILPKHTGIFPAEITHLFINNLEEISLLYPNGLPAATYLRGAEQIKAKKVVQKEIVEYVYVTKEVAPVETIETEAEKIATTTPEITSELITGTTNETDDSIYKWLTALVGLISIASLVVLSSKTPQDKPTTEKELVADDFKIIE